MGVASSGCRAWRRTGDTRIALPRDWRVLWPRRTTTAAGSPVSSPLLSLAHTYRSLELHFCVMAGTLVRLLLPNAAYCCCVPHRAAALCLACVRACGCVIAHFSVWMMTDHSHCTEESGAFARVHQALQRLAGHTRRTVLPGLSAKEGGGPLPCLPSAPCPACPALVHPLLKRVSLINCQHADG